MGLEYGFKVPVAGREIYIGIIAYFSNGPYDQPACDGFFQYIPLTAKITRWSQNGKGQWNRENYGDVISTGGRDFKIIRRH